MLQAFGAGEAVFPADTITTFTTAVTGVLSANIGVVIGILAFVFGIKFIMRLGHM